MTKERAQRYKIGDLIKNRFEVHRVITTGGFGVVYICYVQQAGMPYAIKGFKEEYLLSDEIVNSFRREAYEWTQLEIHQNIVRAYYVEVIEGRPYIFMEYIAGAQGVGSNLKDWIEYNRLDLERALKVATEIANGMAYVYESRGLIHRDLKPANVLVTGDGVAKVADFGLAKATKLVEATALEVEGKATPGSASPVVSRGGGTLQYMAPEQFPEAVLNYYNYSLAPVDTRSDIYAFGLVLYEMFYGKHVFQADPSLESVIAQEAKAVCPRLFDQLCEEHNLDPNKNQKLYDYLKSCIYCFRRLQQLDLPDPSPKQNLNRLIFKCLEIDRNNRYAEFKEVRDELAEIYRETSGKEIKLELTPRELEAWELGNKGFSLTNLDRHEEAIDCYDRAVKIDPRYVSRLGAIKELRLLLWASVRRP